MKENIIPILKTAAILLVIGFTCTLLLALCNCLTEETIASLTEKAEKAAMTETLPAAKKFEAKTYSGDDETVTAVYEGKSEGKTVGYCIKTEPTGYGGAISMMVGVDASGTVTGVKIVSMSETPGLGAKAKEKTFTDGYAGKKAGIKVIKSGNPTDNEISAISGATITSKAVTSGVNSAVAVAESFR